MKKPLNLLRSATFVVQTNQLHRLLCEAFGISHAPGAQKRVARRLGVAAQNYSTVLGRSAACTATQLAPALAWAASVGLEVMISPAGLVTFRRPE